MNYFLESGLRLGWSTHYLLHTTVSSTLNQRLEKIMRELFSYPGNCSPHPFLVFGLLIEKQTSELSSSLLCAVSMFPFNKVVKTFVHAHTFIEVHSSLDLTNEDVRPLLLTKSCNSLNGIKFTIALCYYFEKFWNRRD